MPDEQQSHSIDSPNTDNSTYGKSLQINKNFDKMVVKEVEPTTRYINENIFEDDLIIVIDELANIYFREANEGKEEKIRKQHVLDYINNHNINLKEIHIWLLNNQNDSNSIYLLGYFNFHGIGININKQKALELYQKAAKLDNYVAQFGLVNMYMDGEGADDSYEKAFELSKKLADKEFSYGINNLGYCFSNGIGTEVNEIKAFELYQKAANLGNSVAQFNLALNYQNGEGIEKDIYQAIYWYKKSAENGDEDAQYKLKELLEE